MPTPYISTPEIEEALYAYHARHDANDAQWLLDLLYAKAEKGDRRARRLLVTITVRLEQLGAVRRHATWPPISDPSRVHEIE